MERTVNIGGREYRMKSTAANLLKYKAQFGSDLLADIAEVQKASLPDGSYDLSKLNIEMLYNMVWLLIKAADPNLPPPMEWLDSLDSFPLREAAGEAMQLYIESMRGTAKNG